MNASALARSFYSNAEQPARTPRSIEYEAFARTTSRLKAADGHAKAGQGALAEALHDNRRLWAALAADVAGEGNALPAELRARIFYLAEFTAHHSRKVLAGNAGAAILVEINTAIMRGLRGEGMA